MWRILKNGVHRIENVYSYTKINRNFYISWYDGKI